MKQNESSITSLISAFGRAYHSKYDHPKIFDDFVAPRLMSEREFAEISRNMTEGITFFNQEIAQQHQDNPDEILKWITQVQLAPTILARAAFCEAVLLNEVRFGAEQYVLLGAGMDTFAYRHPELGPRLDIFEVDHPATQQFKRKRLEEAGLEVPGNLHFVPADFTRDNALHALSGAGLAGRKTLFSLLGVSYYLSKEEMSRLIRQLFEHVPAGSSLVLDYADEQLFSVQGFSNRVANMVTMAAAAGEPMKSGFAYPEIERLLEAAGLRIYEHLTPDAAQERFFGDRTDYLTAFETIHYIHAVKR